jgi:hypothetical protein
MKKRGFTDRELDIMFKDNPAKAIGLRPLTSPQPHSFAEPEPTRP